MSNETIPSQIDILEAKIKEVLSLIDVLKRTYCIAKLPIALSDDLELRDTIDTNEKVFKSHEQALMIIENYDVSNLHHNKH